MPRLFITETDLKVALPFASGCGAISLSQFLNTNGLIKLTPELIKEIDDGIWVMGGCLSHPALPRWLCKSCNARMYKAYKKDEI